jgi:hypothetical protein
MVGSMSLTSAVGTTGIERESRVLSTHAVGDGWLHEHRRSVAHCMDVVTKNWVASKVLVATRVFCEVAYIFTVAVP